MPTADLVIRVYRGVMKEGKNLAEFFFDSMSVDLLLTCPKELVSEGRGKESGRESTIGFCSRE